MYHFRFSRFKTCWAFAGIAILLSLGIWQIYRADEKKQILNDFDALYHASPVTLSVSDIKPPAYQQVVFQGKYRRETVFLDNQYYHHQFGFDVLHPVQLADGRWVLVDRGWIAVTRRHADLPGFSMPLHWQTFKGYIYYPSDKNMTLGGLLDRRQGDRLLIEKLDIPFIEKLIGHPLMPFIIRLGKPDEPPFVRDWPLTSMPPSRHMGYAVQWFIMAFVLVVIYFAGSIYREIN